MRNWTAVFIQTRRGPRGPVGRAGRRHLLGCDRPCRAGLPGRCAHSRARGVLLVMAAATTSPLVYLKPELAPDSLILRPVTAEECRRAGEIRPAAGRPARGADCFVVKAATSASAYPTAKFCILRPGSGGSACGWRARADFHRHAGKAAGNFTAGVPPRPPQLCGERRQYPARSVKPKFSLSARDVVCRSPAATKEVREHDA